MGGCGGRWTLGPPPNDRPQPVWEAVAGPLWRCPRLRLPPAAPSPPAPPFPPFNFPAARRLVARARAWALAWVRVPARAVGSPRTSGRARNGLWKWWSRTCRPCPRHAVRAFPLAGLRPFPPSHPPHAHAHTRSGAAPALCASADQACSWLRLPSVSPASPCAVRVTGVCLGRVLCLAAPVSVDTLFLKTTTVPALYFLPVAAEVVAIRRAENDARGGPVFVPDPGEQPRFSGGGWGGWQSGGQRLSGGGIGGGQHGWGGDAAVGMGGEGGWGGSGPVNVGGRPQAQALSGGRDRDRDRGGFPDRDRGGFPDRDRGGFPDRFPDRGVGNRDGFRGGPGYRR